MQLEKIITLANRPVRLRFLALERSLRATGCDLPIEVIPYNADRFELPANSTWWEVPSIQTWLKQEKAHPMMGKYQCLTTANYQFVDSDVVFLRNPATVLAQETGFIASCGHWNNPGDATTPESIQILRQRSTCWQREVFNAGQFACDRALYTEETLRATCFDPRYIETCLHYPHHDQPGLVLLVHFSRVPVHNLTLPPVNMESTWAGDYHKEDFASTWRDEAHKPYIIHWAGSVLLPDRPIDRLFTDFLTQAEKAEWDEQAKARARRQAAAQRAPRSLLQRLARGVRAFRRALRD